MANVALVNLCDLLTRNPLRDHLKMFHIMARRCLMTLSAICRARRRVLECGDGPLGRRVAGRTVSPEQAEVFVFRRVAGSAVEFRFKRGDERVISRP